MTPAEWVDLLWPLGCPDGETLLVSTQSPGSTVNTTPIGDEPAWLSMAGRQVWLNMASRADGTTARGGVADCRSLPALWADLDVDDEAWGVHRGGHTFATYDEAWAVLDAMPVPPSIVVRTGYGLAPYWLLDEPCDVTTGALLLDALKATITRVSDGRADPSVFDVARMMRMPGTYNVKRPDDPRLVTVDLDFMRSHRPRYGADELADMLDLPRAAEVDSSKPSIPHRDLTGDVRPGDDYNDGQGSNGVVKLLEKHGATITRIVGNVVHVTRPGKDVREGPSATVGWVGPNITHVFTSAWPGLPAGTHAPFSVLAHLEHGGDFAACARRLSAEGYGARGLFSFTDLPDELDAVHVSRHFATIIGDRAIFVPGIGWHVWDGMRYRRTDGGGVAIMRLAIAYVERLNEIAPALDGLDGDDLKRAQAIRKQLRAYYSRAQRTNVIEDSKGDLLALADTLDADPAALNTLTGIVNLRTGLVAPHDPAARCTKLADGECAPGVTTDDWTAAQAPLSAEMRHYLQVALGMSLYGRSEADAVFIAYGRGGNGKGTTLGAVVHVLADYASSPPADLFVGDVIKTQERMPLRGARVVMSTETAEDHFLNMERLKALSGGDVIRDRYLYSTDIVEWEPTHTLWLQTNARPRIRNTDEGTWRRLRLVPYEATFLENDADTDIGLRSRLRDEPANRTAVLTWLVAGAVEWAATKRLPHCDEVQLATATWRDEEDAIALFLSDAGYEVTGDREHSIGSHELYAAYRLNAADAGTNPLGQPRFKAEMLRFAERLRVSKLGSVMFVKGRMGNVWTGIRKAGDFAAVIDDTWTPDEAFQSKPEDGTDGPGNVDLPW